MDIDSLAKLYDKYETIINSDIPYAMFMMEILSSYVDFKNMHFEQCYEFSDTSLIKSTKLRYYIQVTLKEKINELFDKKIKELEYDQKEYFEIFRTSTPPPLEKRKEIYDKYLIYSNEKNTFIPDNPILSKLCNKLKAQGYSNIQNLHKISEDNIIKWYENVYFNNQQQKQQYLHIQGSIMIILKNYLSVTIHIKNKILNLINRINTKKSYSYLIDSIIDINKANLSYEIYYQKTEIPKPSNTDVGIDLLSNGSQDLDSISMCSEESEERD